MSPATHRIVGRINRLSYQRVLHIQARALVLYRADFIPWLGPREYEVRAALCHVVAACSYVLRDR